MNRGEDNEMNDNRRKKLSKVIQKLQSSSDMLYSIVSDEQEAMDNVPERMQSSYRYEKMENAVDAMNDAIQKIDEAVDLIETASE